MMQSQQIDNIPDLIKHLEDLKNNLVIDPPVVVRFHVHGENHNRVTLNVVDAE